MKDNYELIFFTSNPYPEGLASTNRIKSYAKELAKKKSVLLLTFSPSISPSYFRFTSGIDENVRYKYLRPSDPKHKTFISKVAYRIITYLNIVYGFLFKYKTKCVLCYIHDIKYIKLLYLISKIKGFKIYNDITETYETYFGNEKSRFQHIQSVRYFDGLIVMTEGIKKYFSNHNRNIFVLPMCVDIDRFSRIDGKIRPYFFYCSGGVFERDGLLDALNGFILFSQKHSGYVFKIAGPINLNDSYHKKVKEIIDSSSDIEYLGEIKSSNIPRLMANSMGLLITPHHDYITKGFPTKIGEYLASGRPVICSNIPSLTEVLSEEFVYMVNSNSPKEISEALETIISSPEQASLVGKRGRYFACEKLSVKPYLNDLQAFLAI